MNSKIKKIILGTAVTSIVITGAYSATYTPPLTMEEFNELVQVYDHEIVSFGNDIDLKNVKNNAIQKFNEIILTRTELNQVMIGGKIYSPQAYMTLRQELVNKANKNINK